MQTQIAERLGRGKCTISRELRRLSPRGTVNTRYVGLRPIGTGVETADILPPPEHVVRPAGRAATGRSALFHGECGGTFLVITARASVASNPEGMVK
jgi:hypothetical protein